jgi:hypothetical protein
VLVVALLLSNFWLAALVSYAPSSFRASISPTVVKQEMGYAYVAAPPFESFVYYLPSDGWSGPMSQLRLFEDGKEMSGPHNSHSDVREVGLGRYSHWKSQIWFSSSDNSDPRSNGRRYEIQSPAAVRASVVLAIVCLNVLALAIVRRKLKLLYGQELHEAAVRPSEASLSWQWGALAIGTTAIAVGIAVASHLEYRTNDEVNMRFIAESVIADSSMSAFVFYQNILVGLALRGLYALVPQLPWYDINVAGGAWIGGLLCIFGILRFTESWLEQGVAIAIAIFATTPLFRSLQFSASAMLLSAGSLSLLYIVLFGSSENRVLTYGLAMVASIAFLWGGLIRLEAAILVLMSATPLLAILVWRRLRKQHIGPLALYLAGAGLAVLAAGFNRYYYSISPGWETFFQDNLVFLRATNWLTLDASRPEEIRIALRASGWTANDYELLSGWLYGDKQLFSMGQMKEFASLAPRTSPMRLMISLYLNLTSLPTEFWLLVCLPFAAALLVGTLRSFVVAAASVVWLFSMTAVIAVIFKAGFEHIIWAHFASTLLVVFALVLSLPRRSRRDSYARAEYAVLSIATLTGSALASIWLVSLVIAAGNATERFRVGSLSHDVAKWPLTARDLIVVWNADFPFETWVRPFARFEPPAWQFFHTTPTARSPLAANLYRKWGTSDAAWAMCHVPGVYRVEDSRRGYAAAHERQLATYMKEHHGEDVQSVEIFTGEVLSLYACKLAG